jgi:hypothetical protein
MVPLTVYGPLDRLLSVYVLWPASPFMVRYVGNGPLDRLVRYTVGLFDRWSVRPLGLDTNAVESLADIPWNRSSVGS